MVRIALKGNRGVSLVEMLVALTILLFVSLAMMQVALVGMESNSKNLLRDEGTRIASRAMNELRSMTGANLNSITNAPQSGVVNSSVRKTTVNFNVTNTISIINSSEIVSAQVFVSWQWGNEMYNTTMKTLLK